MEQLTNINNINLIKIEELANKELKKVIDYLNEKKQVWSEYTDLKLHDASYCDIDFEGYYGSKITFNAEAHNNWFKMFCEDSFEQFIDFLTENNIDFDDSIDRIGRTSSFYFGKYHNYINICDAIIDILNLDNEYPDINFDINDNIITVSRYQDEFINSNENDYIYELLSLINLLFKDFEEEFKPLEIIYNYLTDFKNNQVEYFKNYVIDLFKANI